MGRVCHVISDEEYEKDSMLRGIMKSDIFVEVGSYGDVFHRSYSINDKTLYVDNKGIYTCLDKNLILRKMLKESRRKIREKEEIKDKRDINLHDSGGNG